MLEKGQISQTQFLILILMFLIGTSILLLPGNIISTAKQDAWLSILFGMCTALLLSVVYSTLAKRYPNKTIIEFNEVILGKLAGKVLSFLFSLYFLTLTAGLLRIIGDFITTYIMPETPIQAIEITFLLVVIYGVRLGLETFSRTAEVILPWLLLFSFLLVFFLIPEIEKGNVFPFFEEGIKPIIKAGLFTLGVPFSDIVIFLMIAPYVSSPKKIWKNLSIAVLSGGMLIFIFVLLSILVLGPSIAGRLNYPIYLLAQKVNIGNFIQRIEVLAGGTIFMSMFIKTTICFYSTSLGFAQIFQLKEFRMLTFPFGIIVLILSNLMSPNIIFFKTFLSDTWTPYAIFFGAIFPLLLLGIDSIKIIFTKRKNKLSESR